MDEDEDYELPGGDDFEDVTDLFREAGKAMEPGQLLLTDGFTLMDSMSVIEIGEPRMDSGMTLDEDHRPPFDPLAPLLPEELCYILDRVCSYEMQWHAGYALSQTVFTLQYVHDLDVIMDFWPSVSSDPARPVELLIHVLVACVEGVLKCCDMTWRELTKGRVFDTEDWQSEKSGVSLMEGTQIRNVLSRLESACNWISTNESLRWREPLYNRVMLRKILLELFALEMPMERQRCQTLLSHARIYLRNIRYRPAPPAPPVGSPALLAFDPSVSRRLNTFAPLQVLPVLAQEDTWDALESLLDGWTELCQLSAISHLSTWKTVGNLRALSPGVKAPFLRSLTQSVFFDGYRVLGTRLPIWTIEQFFLETLGLPWARIIAVVRRQPIVSTASYLRDIEQRLARTLISYVKSYWSNPPRRRRHLSNSLLEWHVLYNSWANMVSTLHTENETEHAILNAVLSIILIWRLRIIVEVIFAGFQLDLYVADELPFAYWYASHVIESQLTVIGDIAPVIPKDSAAFAELEYDRNFLAAMKRMCSGMFMLTLPDLPSSRYRWSQNSLKRYKWAFRPEYQTTTNPPIGHPDPDAFVAACAESLEDETYPIADLFSNAQQGFAAIADARDGWAGEWSGERNSSVQKLSDQARRLSKAAPETMRDLLLFDRSVFDWSKIATGYFPDVKES